MMADVKAAELLKQLAQNPPLVLDVRSAGEFAAGHIPGSINIPFWAIPWRAGELRSRPAESIVVYCGHGPRAQLAKAGLRARGFTRIACLAGHWSKWREAGFPQER
jgi:hydroxyacylglutathione hydrolase